jgi:hypothetical protein
MSAVNLSYSTETFTYWSEAGAAGTWTYGSCYGSGWSCFVVIECDGMNCTTGHSVYY